MSVIFSVSLFLSPEVSVILYRMSGQGLAICLGCKTTVCILLGVFTCGHRPSQKQFLEPLPKVCQEPAQRQGVPPSSRPAPWPGGGGWVGVHGADSACVQPKPSPHVPAGPHTPSNAPLFFT